MKNEKRTIDFLNISNFMTAVERVRDQSLRSMAVVVAPLNSDTAKVWETSAEAEKSGIIKGMELAVAKRLDRRVKIIHPNPDLYNSIHKKLLYQASQLTPLYESEGLGRIYLDLTGFDQLYGESKTFAKDIRSRLLQDFSLAPRFGISQNKLLAKAATDPTMIYEPIFEVEKKICSHFLDPFPNDVLPGVSKYRDTSKNRLFNIFEELNLEKVLGIKNLSRDTLVAIFPSSGHSLYQMARGIDYRPVLRPSVAESILVDVHIKETNNSDVVLEHLYQLADKAFFLLREQNKICLKFRVAIRYTDFKFYEKTVPLGYGVSFSYEIYNEIKKTVGFLFSRRTALRYLLLELVDLQKDGMQLSFFEDKNQKITEVIDLVNKKFPDKLNKGKKWSI